jgi:hypothetical protein
VDADGDVGGRAWRLKSDGSGGRDQTGEPVEINSLLRITAPQTYVNTRPLPTAARDQAGSILEPHQHAAGLRGLPDGRGARDRRQPFLGRLPWLLQVDGPTGRAPRPRFRPALSAGPSSGRSAKVPPAKTVGARARNLGWHYLYEVCELFKMPLLGRP